jgi:hypothetical protein
MRGGLERWKRGVDSRGVRHAIAYALEGTCDGHFDGAAAAELYGEVGDGRVTRFIAEQGVIRSDELNAGGLRVWLTGHDPVTGEERGRQRLSPDADLVLDGTINAPKSFSVAALLHPELAAEFEALQDRLRDRIIVTWQRELNARRGHGGLIREGIARLEVVELQHRRSRALDPHIHRHLWLNVKVQGEDGKWSNLDSRVAMRIQTLINAEGELAARTDPEWIAALARHGFTLDAQGEIAELVAAVRPLSRRSAQIETNRAELIAQWREGNAGAEPSRDVLAQIDRRAWAQSRPNKPHDLDEAEWETRVRDELTAIDPRLLNRRTAVSVAAASLERVDVEDLAARAVADADARSACSAGRYSLLDLRAGALRAVAGSGLVASRAEFDPLISEVVDRARSASVSFLSGETVPDHVKGLMADATVKAKMRLASRLDALATPGVPAHSRLLRRASDALGALDAEQSAAAAAIAGTDGLVAITGPAGTGKTTMLRVARAVVSAQRRRMLVVAPTKKAADVAGREIGAEASSIHALLHDYGYRWGRATGMDEWTRLRPGDTDPITGTGYVGPRTFALDRGDRLVIDEAGMVDLQTANALTELALEHGVGLAWVGDPRQALPVGHSGAMAAATRRATARVELGTVHRFTDPAYAELTLRLRDVQTRERAIAVASELVQRGHIHFVRSTDEARDTLVNEYVRRTAAGQRTAVVVATNADANAVNDRIQQHRIATGDLDPARCALGADEQRILVGDIVQTRRNDRAAGVENRATWIIRSLHPDAVILESPTDSTDLRRVSRDYAAEYMHLAYAATVHGVQGETTDAAIVGPDVDAAGLYVGLTRGRHANVAVTIAPDTNRGVAKTAATLLRGSDEITLADSARAARNDFSRMLATSSVMESRARLDWATGSPYRGST